MHKNTDINQKTTRGSALHLAVKLEDKASVEILLKNQADIDLPDH